MKLKLSIIFILFFLIAQSGISQEAWSSQHWKEIKREYNSSTFIYLDSIHLDTLYEKYKAGQRVIISKEGVELSKGSFYGGMGSKCGCEVKPNGCWVKKYRNGNLKEHGVYDCNRKIGTWNYYHENGQLAKIENMQYPYLEFLTTHGMPWDTLKNNINLLSGTYAEFYENGQMKVEGQFEIFEAYCPTDTLVTFDSETYEEVYAVTSGDFWIPTSKKVGIWKYFDDKGSLMRWEEMEVKCDYKTIRPLASRYFELFFKENKN